jgi:hypothetical protein
MQVAPFLDWSRWKVTGTQTEDEKREVGGVGGRFVHEPEDWGKPEGIIAPGCMGIAKECCGGFD